jgi:quinol monooxygenase YgiN
MINKWITFKVAETNSQTFFAALQVLARESLLEEGCVHYAAFQCKDDSGVFTVLEQWASEDAFENHRIAPHITTFKNDCGCMILEKSATSLNQIQ